MSVIRRCLDSLLRHLGDDRGQDIIEYGLLAAFISIALVLLLMPFSDPLNALYERVLTALNLVSS